MQNGRPKAGIADFEIYGVPKDRGADCVLSRWKPPATGRTCVHETKPIIIRAGTKRPLGKDCTDRSGRQFWLEIPRGPL